MNTGRHVCSYGQTHVRARLRPVPYNDVYLFVSDCIGKPAITVDGNSAILWSAYALASAADIAVQHEDTTKCTSVDQTANQQKIDERNEFENSEWTRTKELSNDKPRTSGHRQENDEKRKQRNKINRTQKDTRIQEKETTQKINKRADNKKTRGETRRQRKTGWAGEALEVRVCDDACWDQCVYVYKQQRL